MSFPPTLPHLSNKMDWTIPLEHPGTRGHFPGNPILPGVCLLDEVLRCAERFAGRKVVGVNQCKFLEPLRPADTVRIIFAPRANETAALHFEVQRIARAQVVDDGGHPVVARGQLALQ